MNQGKNNWRISGSNFHHPNEIWKLRLDVDKTCRLASAEELRVYKTGFIEYWTIDFLFSIHRAEGECLSGDLKYREGREKSNQTVLQTIQTFRDSEIPLFPEQIELQFIYLEKLFNLTQNRMLSNRELEQFKKMYHAIQRHDYEIVIEHLTGLYGTTPYKPNRILNLKENL